MSRKLFSGVIFQVAFFVLGTFFLIATLSQATPAQASEEDQKELFARLDANQDGRLTPAEVPAAKRSLLKRLLRTADSDQDGSLDPQEFAAGLRPSRTEKPLEKKQPSEIPGAAQFTKIVGEMDANGDGRIVPKEVPEKHQKMFQQFLAQADQDKDGKITKREMNQRGPQLIRVVTRNMRPGAGNNPQRGAGNLFRRWDTDKDGKIVLNEVPKPRQDGFQRLLNRADRDKDQALNRREFQAAFAMMNRAATGRQDKNKPKQEGKPSRQPDNKPDNKAKNKAKST